MNTKPKPKPKPKPENPQAMTPPSPSADFATPVDRGMPNGSRQTSPPSPQSPQLQFQDSPRAARFAARSPTPTTTPRTAAINMITSYIGDIVPNAVNVNKKKISDAVSEVAKKRVQYEDGADLCRMVVDRVNKRIIINFTTPPLTQAQLEQLCAYFIRSGGSKKKHRTGKNTKSKTRTRNNSRTIKKMKIRRIRK